MDSERTSGAEFFASNPSEPSAVPAKPQIDQSGTEASSVEHKIETTKPASVKAAELDFFSAAPVKPRRSDERLPNVSEKQETKAENQSTVSLFVDDEEDIKPKIARPRDYTPKDSASPKKWSGTRDHADNEESEKPKKSKPVPPTRRSFSGKKIDKKRASGTSDDDLDEDENENEDEDAAEEKSFKPKIKSKESSLDQEATILGITMTKKNHAMVACILLFVGFVFSRCS